jgi:hypothetical protein
MKCFVLSKSKKMFKICILGSHDLQGKNVDFVKKWLFFATASF